MRSTVRQSKLVRILISLCALLFPTLRPASPVSSMTGPATSGLTSLELITQVEGPVNAVAVVEPYAYIGVGPRLVILDMTRPDNPRRIGLSAPILRDRAGIGDVHVAGNYAYVAAGIGGMAIFDISQPYLPTQVASDETEAWMVSVTGQLLFVTQGGKLRIWNVADPTHPQVESEINTPNMGYDDFTDVTAAGNYVYVTQTGAFNGVQAIDVTDPRHPAIVDSLPVAGLPNSIKIDGNKLYIGARNTSQSTADGGFHIVDARNPHNLQELGALGGSITAVDIFGTRAYALGSSVLVIDIASPQSPREIGRYDVPGSGQSIAATSRHVYVAERPRSMPGLSSSEVGGLRIVDVTRPSAPASLGFYNTTAEIRDVAVSGNYAFAAAGKEGFVVFDLRNLVYPRTVAILESEGSQSLAVAISGTLAYVLERSFSGGQGGLRVVDISDVHNLRTVSFSPFDDTGVDLTVVGGTVYVLNYNGFIVFDVTNPERPTALCSMSMEQGGGLAVRNTYAFVARRGGLSVIDVADPASCTQVGTLNLAGSSTSIAVNANLAYIGQNWYTNGLNIVDIANPQRPRAIGFLATPYPPYGIAAANARVYLTNFGLRVIDAQDPSHPREESQMVLPGWPGNLELVGRKVYVAASFGGMLVLRDNPSATAVIPVSGGTLTAPFDRTTYRFSAGTFPAETVVTHTARYGKNFALSSVRVGIGHFFENEARLLSTGQPVDPARPYELVVTYFDSELGPAMEGTLALHRWDGTQWVQEPSSVLDPFSNTIRAAPTQFGLWAVLGDTRPLFFPVVQGETASHSEVPAG